MFKDPEVAAAFQDISQNPSNYVKYLSNPKVTAVIEKMSGKYSGMAGGFPGATPPSQPPSADDTELDWTVSPQCAAVITPLLGN